MVEGGIQLQGSNPIGLDKGGNISNSLLGKRLGGELGRHFYQISVTDSIKGMSYFLFVLSDF